MARAVGVLVRRRNRSARLCGGEGGRSHSRHPHEPQSAVRPRAPSDPRGRRRGDGDRGAGVARGTARMSRESFIRSLVLVIDIVGTFVFALSGAAAGIKRELDLLGVLVLSFAAATAGGVARDVLIGAVPPAALSDWRYLATALIAGSITFSWYRLVERLQNPVLFFDALGLALFAVSGAQKALAFGLSPIMAALLGMLTGIGGGMLRDILLSEVPAVLRSDLYAVAALAGAAVVVVGEMLHSPSAITTFVAPPSASRCECSQSVTTCTFPPRRHGPARASIDRGRAPQNRGRPNDLPPLLDTHRLTMPSIAMYGRRDGLRDAEGPPRHGRSRRSRSGPGARLCHRRTDPPPREGRLRARGGHPLSGPAPPRGDATPQEPVVVVAGRASPPGV